MTYIEFGKKENMDFVMLLYLVRKLQKRNAAALLVFGFMANTGLAQESRELTGEDELFLQVRSVARVGASVDDAKNKLLVRFAKSDIDGGGVSDSDYQLYRKKRNATLRAATVSKWLKRDLDGDGRITRSELEAFLSSIARQPIRRSGVRIMPTPDQVASILAKLVDKALKTDRNRDGVVVFSEILEQARAEQSKSRMRISRNHLIPMSLDSDGNSIVELREFQAAVDSLLGRIDSDGDGKFSAIEVSESKTRANSLRKIQRAILQEKQRAERAQKIAEKCKFPEAPSDAKIVLLSTGRGQALSNVSLGGSNSAVSVANVWIEKGKEPLYLVVNSSGSMIWEISGDIGRLTHVVVNQVRGKEADVPRVGVIGVPREKVHIAPRVRCLQYIGKATSRRAKTVANSLKYFIGHQADITLAVSKLAAVSVPGGIIDKTTAYKNTLPTPKSKHGKTMWQEMLLSNPGGVVRIKAADVVSRVAAAEYKVLPKKAGIAQLLDNGSLRVLETQTVLSLNGIQIVNPGGNDTIKAPPGVQGAVRNVPSKFLIVRKMHYPGGLAEGRSISFVLAPGVPEPDGDPGRSCVVSEETGQLTAQTVKTCR